MKSLCTALLICLSLPTWAQKSIVVNTDIEKATVFLNGAQLFHTASVHIPSGPSEIVLQGFSNSLDQNSIQGGGKGDFTILDIQYRLFYPEPVDVTPELSAIDKKIKIKQDSIVEVDYDLRAIAAKQEALNVQKMMLMNNALLHNTNNDSLELLQHSIAYYESKLSEVLDKLLELDKQSYVLNNRRAAITARISELYAYRSQQAAGSNPNAMIPQVVMQVYADAAVDAKMEVNYITYNAGWYATYDIRANDIAKPVELAYKANVWQNSGIEWKNVKLTCSTGNPMQGNTLPELTAWYLGYYQYYYDRDVQTLSGATAPAAATKSLEEVAGYDDFKDESLQKSTNASNFTTQNATVANVEFEINLKYTVPSDGKGHVIALQSEQLKTKYNYLIIPKLEQSAFLIARITDWEKINLLPGNANIYFNNTYVGKTYLNPLTLSDTLSVSMGRDRSIEVKRELLADKSTDKILNAKAHKTMSYTIDVRNTKAIGIEIILKDQVPLSSDDDVKVEVLEQSAAQLNEDTGILTWRETLASKQKKTWTFGFEVSYPKDEPLSLQ